MVKSAFGHGDKNILFFLRRFADTGRRLHQPVAARNLFKLNFRKFFFYKETYNKDFTFSILNGSLFERWSGHDVQFHSILKFLLRLQLEIFITLRNFIILMFRNLVSIDLP